MKCMIRPCHPSVHFRLAPNTRGSIYILLPKRKYLIGKYMKITYFSIRVMKNCKQVENIQDVVNKMYDVLQDYKLTEEGE